MDLLEKLKEQLTVKIDHRERRSAVPDLLKARGWKVKWTTLPSGDYVCGKVAIERKTIPDFVQSLHKGRLFREIDGMLCDPEEYKGLFVYVEGTLSELSRYMQREGMPDSQGEHSASGSTASCDVRGVTVKMVENEHLFVVMLEKHIEKFNDGKNRSVGHFLSRRTKKDPSDYEIVSNVIMGFPNMGNETANALISHFGSLKALFNATEKDMLNVKGVGKKTAKVLYDWIQHDFNEIPL